MIALQASKGFFLGGQAVIEGVVIRSKNKVSLAVRGKGGNIKVRSWKVRPYSEVSPIFGLPIVRGIVSLYDAIVWGIKTLYHSANEVLDEKENLSLWELSASIALAIGLTIGLFIIFPAFVSRLFELKFGLGKLSLNLVEGFLRVVIFIMYLVLIGFSKEVKGVFAYHGAEHKTINAYETLKTDLTPDIVERFSRFHYRCGTSFILFVLVISILSFAIFEQDELINRIFLRLALIPFIAGVSYEVLRFSFSSSFTKFLAKPGLWLQYLTTREPSREQIEVGIVALKEALGDVGEAKED